MVEDPGSAYATALIAVMIPFIVLYFMAHILGLVSILLVKEKGSPSGIAVGAYALSWIGMFFGPCILPFMLVTAILSGMALRNNPNARTRRFALTSGITSSLMLLMFVGVVVVVILYV